jgi:hypothetical protein
MNAITPTFATPNNFAAQKREAMIGAIPRLAWDGLDMYVSGARAFAQVGETASGVLQVGCYGLGALHGIAGIRSFIHAADAQTTSEQLRHRASAYGDCITGLGYVGLAAGMGAWALPLVAIGLATTNYARFA